MAKHNVSLNTPSLIHPERHARNGELPNATAFSRIAHGANYVATRAKKCVFYKAQNLRAVLDGGAVATLFPFRFMTGEHTDTVVCHVGVTFSTYAYGANVPWLQVALTRASDATTVATANIYFTGTAAGTTVGPDEMSHKRMFLTGLTPNTEYYSFVQASYGIVVAYMTAEEESSTQADDSLTGATNPAVFLTGHPIEDDQVQDLVDASTKLWKHNGAHLLSWCADYEIQANATYIPTTNATVYTSILSGSPTFRLPTQYHGTEMRESAIPVRLCVYACRTAGTGTGDVALWDGTNFVEITGMAIGVTLQWFTVDTTISGASSADWQIIARTSVGTTTIGVAAVCLYEYET